MKELGGIPFVFPGVKNIKCFFGTAWTGNFACLSLGQESEPNAQTKVAKRRKLLMESLGIKAWSEVFQVHKDNFVQAKKADASHLIEADGHHTDEQGLGLSIKTADCQPILLTDINGKAVAALHVGWRGNLINFIDKAVKEFSAKYSLRVEDIMAVRGPSLGPQVAEFVNFEKEWPEKFNIWFNESSKTMDLWGLSRHQLKEAGLNPRNIFSLDLCTLSMPDYFFSHRQGHKGRQISIIFKE